jgi:hypothetical protein
VQDIGAVQRRPQKYEVSESRSGIARDTRRFRRVKVVQRRTYMVRCRPENGEVPKLVDFMYCSIQFKPGRRLRHKRTVTRKPAAQDGVTQDTDHKPATRRWGSGRQVNIVSIYGALCVYR